MEPKATTTSFGSSLPVRSVQELAKEALTRVPRRYVRTDLDPPFICNTNSSIPVIDMMKLLSVDFMDSELENLHLACRDWGFFQLINHGVSSSLVDKVRQEIPEFFNLPMEEKKRYWQQPGELEGFGQVFVFSEEQKLEWADLFYLTTLPIHHRKPHLFPKLPFSLRDTLEAYSTEIQKLAMKLLHQIAKAIGMEPEEMREMFGEGRQGIRMNYCPPCPQPEVAIGLSPHYDVGGIDFVLQLNEVDGLQINKDGMWVPVKPLPGAFIISIGNILELVTNGAYRSIQHRVTVNSKKERLSVAAFCSPKLEGVIGPAPSLVTAATPPMFRTLGVAEYFKGYFSRQLEGKSYVDLLRLNSDAVANM